MIWSHIHTSHIVRNEVGDSPWDTEVSSLEVSQVVGTQDMHGCAHGHG